MIKKSQAVAVQRDDKLISPSENSENNQVVSLFIERFKEISQDKFSNTILDKNSKSILDARERRRQRLRMSQNDSSSPGMFFTQP